MKFTSIMYQVLLYMQDFIMKMARAVKTLHKYTSYPYFIILALRVLLHLIVCISIIRLTDRIYVLSTLDGKQIKNA